MEYGPLGRRIERSFPNPNGSGTETQQWHYATSGNGAGQLASESDNVTGFTRSLGDYNTLGEPTSIQETYNGGVKGKGVESSNINFRINSVSFAP